VDFGSAKFETFVLNRLLVNPDETFEKLLGEEDLQATFNTGFSTKLDETQNFVCENIFQFTVTFHVQVTNTNSTPPTTENVPVTIGPQGAKSFKITGNGIVTEGGSGTTSPDALAAGRLTAMELSVTVISDFGIDQLRNRSFSGDQKSEILNQHSYQYTKLVQLPSM
jgi:hypothetical protein